MELIFCRGGTHHCDKVLPHGWTYGLRSDATAYHDHVSFVDINWKRGRDHWEYHVQRVLSLRPKMAMLPDWEHGIRYDELITMHYIFLDAGIVPMWTPKQCGVVDKIPSDAVIGVSVPTGHGANLPEPEDVIGRELHMLGGEPDAIRFLTDKIYHKSTVRSVDTSYFVRHASLGKYWSPVSGAWVQTHRTFDTDDLIELNAMWIRDYLLADAIPAFNMSRRPIRRIWRAMHNVTINQLSLL